MVELNGIKLKNRFLVSAGALEYGRGWPWERPLIRLGLIRPEIFGGIVTKTLAIKSRIGHYIDPFEFEKRSLMSHLCHIFSGERKKVLMKIPGGWLNNMGWWGIGIDYWTEKIYPRLKDISIIPNIGGFSVEEYLVLINKINSLSVTAVEIDISCPNIKGEQKIDRNDFPLLLFEAKKLSRHPLILKIGSSESDIQLLSRTAQALGINAISGINAVPILGGAYSGPGIKYIALKAISDLRKAVKIPIIGGGGISSWKDCQEFFCVGADAVSFGSIHLLKPWRPTQIVKHHSK